MLELFEVGGGLNFAKFEDLQNAEPNQSFFGDIFTTFSKSLISWYIPSIDLVSFGPRIVRSIRQIRWLAKPKMVVTPPSPGFTWMEPVRIVDGTYVARMVRYLLYLSLPNHLKDSKDDS
jgi:hypothetical protein